MEHKLAKEDFTLPEVFCRCWKCHENLSSCIICGEPFDSEINTEVACGGTKGHICWSCWDCLPEDEGE